MLIVVWIACVAGSKNLSRRNDTVCCFVQKLREILKERTQLYTEYRKHIALRANYHFQMMLSQRGFTGRIKFRHNEGELHLLVSIILFQRNASLFQTKIRVFLMLWSNESKNYMGSEVLNESLLNSFVTTKGFDNGQTRTRVVLQFTNACVYMRVSSTLIPRLNEDNNLLKLKLLECSPDCQYVKGILTNYKFNFHATLQKFRHLSSKFWTTLITVRKN